MSLQPLPPLKSDINVNRITKHKNIFLHDKQKGI